MNNTALRAGAQSVSNTYMANKISEFSSEDYSSEDIESIIYQLLEGWKNKQ